VTAAAHVTESTLARTVGATTTNTRNTGYGTTSTPRFSTGLVTSITVDTVGLPVVLGNLVMDE